MITMAVLLTKEILVLMCMFQRPIQNPPISDVWQGSEYASVFWKR